MARATRWAAALAAVALVAACRQAPEALDPYHPPQPGEAPPEVVVQLLLVNRGAFDILPTHVNGVRVAFNGDPSDNKEEPLRIPPGRVRFVYRNVGTISHNLWVYGTAHDGGPVEVMAPRDPGYLLPGRVAEVEVELKEGTYSLSCGVTNHEARGMWRPLIVTAEAAYPPPPLGGAERGT